MKRKKLHDYQQGGAVRGPGTATSDSILARVSNGEYVLPKPAVDLAGVENLNALRSAALSGYASGGLVAGTGTYPAKRGSGLGRLGKMMGGEALESLLGIGPGVKGFAAGMTYSPEAQAQALDVTQTREYRNAQNAARQGQAPRFGFGEAPEAALQRMQQQQAVFDDQYRQMTGGPSPTEQRMLREMNQFNPRAMGLPQYAVGGLVDEVRPYDEWQGTTQFRGGYTGAETDDQAARAMRDRTAQSANAQQMIGSMNRGAEAERDTRAARFGLNRNTLDAMEGRGQPQSGGLPVQPGILSVGKAGESFGSDVLDRDRFMRQFQPPPGRRMNPKWAAARAAGQQTWDQGQLAPQQLAAQQKASLLQGFLDMQNQAASRAFDQQKFSSQQEMDQRRLGLDSQRFGLDRQKAALDTVRNRGLDQSRMEKDARIDPNDIKAALMQRYLQGGPDAAQAFDAMKKLFPDANPLAYLLTSPPQ